MSEAVKIYRVTAPYITVKTMTHDGRRVIGLQEGAPLPHDVEEATIRHLLSHGLIAELGHEPVDLSKPSPRARVDAAESQVKVAKDQCEAAAKALKTAEETRDKAIADARKADAAADQADADADADAAKADAAVKASQAAAQREAKAEQEAAAARESGKSVKDEPPKPGTRR